MKIKIHFITQVYLIISLIAGYFNEILTIYACLLVHELGHYVMIKIFRKDINLLEISPLGGILHIDKCQNDHNYKELIIYLGGPMSSLILYLVLKYNIASEIWIKSSLYVLILNLLPILPLDGAKIIMTLKQFILPFRKVQRMTSFLSIVVCFLLIVYFVEYYNYVIILGFFLYLNMIKMINIPYEYYQFLWYKYLHPNKKLKEKMLVESNKIFYSFYKGYNHIFFINNRFHTETDVLKRILKGKDS